MLSPEQVAYWLLRAQSARTNEQMHQLQWELGLLLEGDELATVRRRIRQLPSIQNQIENLNRYTRKAHGGHDKAHPAEQVRRPLAVAHLVYAAPRRGEAEN